MKIYKDFHNLSFPRHILQKFHFGFKFYCAYPQIQAQLYSGIGSRIRSVNQPSAQ